MKCRNKSEIHNMGRQNQSQNNVLIPGVNWEEAALEKENRNHNPRMYD